MARKLEGLKVAILAADGFEQIELIEPRKALDQEGSKTFVISPSKAKVRSWTDNNWSFDIPVDVDLEKAEAKDYDALLLPGGVINPDRLRLIPRAIDFIRHFVQNNKPIAAICHGPWTLINAEGVRDKTVTSWPSLQVDLTNAGATWVDKEVVTSGLLVTSRKPADIPFFNEAMIELFEQAKAK